ncbi:hypothetical protein Asppvi_010937 [Aspergillus pseudoviridinutans]|uniref:chitinase n=1 Tax=Aspergillus pseudoviridinutans TaxID=1517512 RepID=A0A9P3BIX9_9EURO|nr:uncharacterized protein Asppvi_010937 [Aspergillus pseudoviridinutans]GIJ91962.1 hypothetical protein Asppvi_010937 [Aspergillus pseudoviridinutans]
MDGSTPATLFQETTNLKSIKQDIKVFVSIGGWTFSDNDTSTQPLFGQIAADATKRQRFADNVVYFMKQYGMWQWKDRGALLLHRPQGLTTTIGFGGVDIDWEYPAAPDRRGNPEDTENYVLLLKTMRETFDASGSTYGLTFTAPSSYWYLRWFDLPNMIKYADWINLMSYDLHGAWDATNPIGSIVQAHTNLTEIKLATDLFWRVNIPPSKLVMGFGFYGRSFTLSDPACTAPGCPFSGASKPGPCSDTGGILAYYEIMAALDGSTSSSKRATISPTHDKAAAVNYFTFHQNQWVSYDDATTFKQKVDWADSVGLGGGMIWASDLDTDKYTAHGALLDKTIQSNPSLQAVNKALSNPVAVVEDLAGSNGQKCFVYSGKCVNLNDNKAMSNACGSGYTVVGWDDAGCGKRNCHCGKPVCCPTNSAPKSCIWRGDDNGGGAGADCSAQCRPGEINIKGIRSSWGGGFVNDGGTDKCGRGYKVFCCSDPDYASVTKGCSYAKCRASCPSGKSEAFKNYDNCCHWESGSSGADCANANCNATEVEVDRATYGDQSKGCDWGRQKAMCCTIKTAPPKPATCSTDLCKKFPGYCSTGDNDEGANDWTKRDLTLLGRSGKDQSLEKRGNAEIYYPKHITGVRVIAWAYPALRVLYNEFPELYQILRRWFRLIPGYCVGPSINSGTFANEHEVPPSALSDLEAEHPIDRQLAMYFLDSTVTGVLQSGQRASLPRIDAQLLRDVWLADNDALANEPPVGGPRGIRPNTPNDRFMEAFGSENYPYPFIGVGRDINGAKGRIMKGSVPCTLTRVDTLARNAVMSDSQGDVDSLLQSIRVTFAVFEYLNDAQAAVRFNAVRQQIYLQATYIERRSGIPNFAAWWNEWLTDYLATTEQRIRNWARDAIDRAAAPFVQAHNEHVDLFTYAQVIGALEQMLQEVENIRFPPDTSMRNP